MSRYNWLSSFPIMGRINQWLGRFLTPTGKAVFLANILFLLGSSHLETPVYLLCGACTSLLLVAFSAVRLYRPRVTLQSSLPSLVEIDSSFFLTITVENLSKRSAWDICVTPIDSAIRKQNMTCRSPSTTIHHLRSGERHSFLVEFTAGKRGAFPHPEFRIKSSFPFNLIYVADTVAVEGEILVAPRKANCDLRQLAPDHLISAGQHANVLAAENGQLAGVREYVPGLPSRRWDYAAWARLGTPHIREFESENNTTSTILLDFSYCDSEERSETAISIARSIATELNQQGSRLGSLVVGGKWIDLSWLETELQLEAFCQHLARIDTILPGNPSAVLENLASEEIAFLIVPLSNSMKSIDHPAVKKNFPNVVPIVVSDAVDHSNDTSWQSAVSNLEKIRPQGSAS